MCLIPATSLVFGIVNVAIQSDPVSKYNTNYSQTSKVVPRSSSFTPFTHNYHSLPSYYQDCFYLDITRENVHNIKTYRDYATSSDYDWCYDRFNYLFYDDYTNVCVYDLDNNPTEDSQYLAHSISCPLDSNGNEWIAADGFAYIAKTEGLSHSNSFYHTFANDINLASYFDSSSTPNIYGDICTYKAIDNFVEKNIDAKSNTLSLNFSTLLANDLDRDNAVLALLNPMLWDAILTGLNAYGEAHNVTTSIKLIDLSYNNLRIVPNIASIPNINQDGWMFYDNSLYPKVNLAMNTEAAYYERYLGITKDGCIDTINLSHNSLTYFNFYSYRQFDDEYIWFPTSNTQTIYCINSKLSDYPSLVTLVKCRFEDCFDNFIDDFENPIPNIGGVILDYNYLPWLTFIFTKYDQLDNPNYQNAYWVYMMQSWDGVSIASFEDCDLCCARSYLTYTCYNYYNPESTLVNFTENALGMGVYQYDNIVITSEELYHYINFSLIYGHLFTTEISDINQYMFLVQNSYNFASEVTKNRSVTWNICQNLATQYIIRSGISSTGINTNIISLISRSGTRFSTWEYFDNDLKGDLYLLAKSYYCRKSYFPSNLHITDDSSIDQIANTILNSFSINSYHTLTFDSWIQSYTSYELIAIIYGIASIGIGALFVSQNLNLIYQRLKYKKKKHQSNK